MVPRPALHASIWTQLVENNNGAASSPACVHVDATCVHFEVDAGRAVLDAADSGTRSIPIDVTMGF
jgi:hypothetical protein